MILGTNLNVSLTTGLCEFVTDEVRSGRFRSASEAVRAGLRALQHHAAIVPPVLSSTPDARVPFSCDAMTSGSPLELRYRAILKSALEYAIVALDENSRIIEWNAGATMIMT